MGRFETKESIFKIGDIVRSNADNDLFLIVTEECDNDYNFGVIDLSLMEITRIIGDERYFTKTGRYIDIENILNLIKETCKNNTDSKNEKIEIINQTVATV